MYGCVVAHLCARNVGSPRKDNPSRKTFTRMPQNIYLGNLPTWVTADDIRSWLESSDLVCDSVRVIRDFETQESKGYAFVEAPNEEEMESIIQRFNRAPIDGKLLRAKTAHPKGEKPAASRGGVRGKRTIAAWQAHQRRTRPHPGHRRRQRCCFLHSGEEGIGVRSSWHPGRSPAESSLVGRYRFRTSGRQTQPGAALPFRLLAVPPPFPRWSSRPPRKCCSACLARLCRT